MKRILFAVIGCGIGLALHAQDQVNAYIKEAQDFMVQKDYKQAQLSLQDAVNALNVLIAQQIGDMLPDEINGLRADGEAEVEAAGMAMMGGGVQISKEYTNPNNDNNTADVQIITNSPMLASLSMYLSNPAMMGPEYKSVKVGSIRAILKSESEDNGSGGTYRDSELQIPMGQTLITINMHGFASEAEELAFASKMDLAKLKELLGE